MELVQRPKHCYIFQLNLLKFGRRYITNWTWLCPESDQFKDFKNNNLGTWPCHTTVVIILWPTWVSFLVSWLKHSQENDAKCSQNIVKSFFKADQMYAHKEVSMLLVAILVSWEWHSSTFVLEIIKSDFIVKFTHEDATGRVFSTSFNGILKLSRKTSDSQTVFHEDEVLVD